MKTVMEGDVLNLPTGKTEPRSLEDVMWLFERGDRTFRIAQMYQGFSPFYDKSLTDRVEMDPHTGSLSIYNISTTESGLYTASLTINGFVTRKKIKVDVYASVSLPAVSNSFTDTQTQESYSCTAANPVSHKSIRLHMKHLCPHYEDCLKHCGDVEVLIRLILSALVGLATVVFLLEHMYFWSVQGRL
ncbi:uncharacterized protein LOC130409237 isoform X4 [Triplophysa dalaica]|nr:uncharacterized protein LOC130409237 isoform X4 [Triplophysa dalaica]